MKAEIISVGTELLLGHTINTDAAYVARELADLGVDLLHVHTVGDNPGRLKLALREALGRCDIVVTTGGLGPTDDDLTKETVAGVANAPLELHEESRKYLETFFQGRSMTANQLKQAQVPRGCVVFPNHAGTAPGCAVSVALEDGRTGHVLMLPGPPSELLPMLSRHAVPYVRGLVEASENAVIHSLVIRTFGVGEGAGAAAIADLTGNPNPTAATYTTDSEMFVRVTAKAADHDSAAALCRPLAEDICRRYGDRVYAVVDAGETVSLEGVVIAELIRQSVTLSTAESCTGGLLAKRITDVPGASGVFRGGMVTYADEAKTDLLGVDAALIDEHGAVSEPVAVAMARGARERCKTELGVGITGVAGPSGGTAEKPVGLVHIALAHSDGVTCRTMTPFGRLHDRQWLRERAASEALDMIRRRVLNLPEREPFEN